MDLLKRKRFREGFTLIELLIVIVIIGILVAIALPNFIAAQNRAKNASLKSNIRSLAMVAQTYSVDWGGNAADNVNVLYNEATAKNYWKNFKNPYTGESGLGFAVANYSQAVTLITSLEQKKLACNNCFMIAAASSSGTTGDSALPAQDVFNKAGMAAYLTNGHEWLVAGSIPLKGGDTTTVKWFTERDKLVSAASSNKVRIAFESKDDGYLSSIIDKIASQLSPFWKDQLKSWNDNWVQNKEQWNKQNQEWYNNYGKQLQDTFDSIIAGLTPEQGKTAKEKTANLLDKMNGVNDYYTKNFEKLQEWDKFWVGNYLEGADKIMPADMRWNKLWQDQWNDTSFRQTYDDLVKEGQDTCWNGGSNCEAFNQKWNTFWNETHNKMYQDTEYQEKSKVRDKYFQDLYSSQKYNDKVNEMQTYWQGQNEPWQQFWNSYSDVGNYGNEIGNNQYSNTSYNMAWNNYSKSWSENYYTSKSSDQIQEGWNTWSALWQTEWDKVNGINR